MKDVGNPRVAIWQSRLVWRVSKIRPSRPIDKICGFGADVAYSVNDEGRNAQQGRLLRTQDKDVQTVKSPAPRPGIVQGDLKLPERKGKAIVLLTVIDPGANFAIT
jgi:hypothetical protein